MRQQPASRDADLLQELEQREALLTLWRGREGLRQAEIIQRGKDQSFPLRAMAGRVTHECILLPNLPPHLVMSSHEREPSQTVAPKKKNFRAIKQSGSGAYLQARKDTTWAS